MVVSLAYDVCFKLGPEGNIRRNSLSMAIRIREEAGLRFLVAFIMRISGKRLHKLRSGMLAEHSGYLLGSLSSGFMSTHTLNVCWRPPRIIPRSGLTSA